MTHAVMTDRVLLCNGLTYAIVLSLSYTLRLMSLWCWSASCRCEFGRETSKQDTVRAIRNATDDRITPWQWKRHAQATVEKRHAQGHVRARMDKPCVGDWKRHVQTTVDNRRAGHA